MHGGSERDPHGRLILSEGGYSVRQIMKKERLTEAYKLRYEIFVCRLDWVKGTGGGMETDEFDEGAVMLGLYDDEDWLVGCMRVIPPGRKFMLEGPFSGIISAGTVQAVKRYSVEISRLCLTPEAGRRRLKLRFGETGISMLLIKGLYRWCRLNGYRSVCAVTDPGLYDLYRDWGLPVEALGDPVPMNGDWAVAVKLDWENLDKTIESGAQGVVDWLRS